MTELLIMAECTAVEPRSVVAEKVYIQSKSPVGASKMARKIRNRSIYTCNRYAEAVRQHWKAKPREPRTMLKRQKNAIMG